MNKELTNKLKEKYPLQFSSLKYIECGDGWYDIIDRLCSVIKNRMNNVNRNKNVNDIDCFAWTQIKEKFGGLRAYACNADDYMNGAIAMAETTSYTICEFSGEKGKLRKRKIKENGETVPAWMKTLSDVEAEKEGYVKE
jgi:hypothetical protein